MDIIYEKYRFYVFFICRNRIKEREKEDALYAGKEKFITSAYKRKLEADRKWMEEVRKKELAKGNKGRFLTKMMNSRADEPEESVETGETGEAGESKAKTEGKIEKNAVKASSQNVKADEDEDEDEFDGFILAPPEEQIKGNVSEEESDAGIIRAPDQEKRERRGSESKSHQRERKYSRSRSRSRSRSDSRSGSRSRSHSRSRRHRHSRHRRHHH